MISDAGDVICVYSFVFQSLLFVWYVAGMKTNEREGKGGSKITI